MALRILGDAVADEKVFPDLTLYNLSSLKDTNEQWDVVRDSPTEYSKAVYRDAALAIWKNNTFIPTLAGPFYCLADGISRECGKRSEMFGKAQKCRKALRRRGSSR